MKMIELNVIFGSPSDKDKVIPGILKATGENPDLEIVVHFASADNTPDKVERILQEIQRRDDAPKAYVSGAGMSNVLTGVIKAQANVEDLVIGIPISDSKTNGLSSFLSTSEKPPLNPVLMTGINNSYAAVNIGYKFLKRMTEPKILQAGRVVLLEHKGFPDNDPQYEILKKELNSFGVNYDSVEIGEVEPDDIVLNVCSLDGHEIIIIDEVDKKLNEGYGIQVGVIRNVLYQEIYHLTDFFQDVSSTGIVGLGAYKNAAIVAAQLNREMNALEVIYKKKTEKTNSLDKEKELFIKEGKIQANIGGI